MLFLFSSALETSIYDPGQFKVRIQDCVASKLTEAFGPDYCEISRLSGLLKHEFARQNGLDFDCLLDSRHDRFTGVKKKEMLIFRISAY